MDTNPMINRSQRRFLIYCAEVYTKLGYSIGLANKKKLLEAFESRDGINDQRARSSLDTGLLRQWDGISLILDDVVCVDFDTDKIDITEELPTTWTEKTARGWHYFYRMPQGRFACRIAYRPHLDLLVKDKRIAARAYGEASSPDELWYGHALISPTENYLRTHPSEMMAKDQLPMAPSWVVAALIC